MHQYQKSAAGTPPAGLKNTFLFISLQESISKKAPQARRPQGQKF
jgi:hypothetical protein